MKITLHQFLILLAITINAFLFFFFRYELHFYTSENHRIEVENIALRKELHKLKMEYLEKFWEKDDV